MEALVVPLYMVWINGTTDGQRGVGWFPMFSVYESYLLLIYVHSDLVIPSLSIVKGKPDRSKVGLGVDQWKCYLDRVGVDGWKSSSPKG